VKGLAPRGFLFHRRAGEEARCSASSLLVPGASCPGSPWLPCCTPQVRRAQHRPTIALNHANGVGAYQPGVTPREHRPHIPLPPCKWREHTGPHAKPPPAHRHLAVRSTPPRLKRRLTIFRKSPVPRGTTEISPALQWWVSVPFQTPSIPRAGAGRQKPTSLLGRLPSISPPSGRAQHRSPGQAVPGSPTRSSSRRLRPGAQRLRGPPRGHTVTSSAEPRSTMVI